MTIFGADVPIGPIVDALSAVGDAVGDAYGAVVFDAPGFADVLEAFDYCVQREVPYFLVVVHFLDSVDRD